MGGDEKKTLGHRLNFLAYHSHTMLMQMKWRTKLPLHEAVTFRGKPKLPERKKYDTRITSMDVRVMRA